MRYSRSYQSLLIGLFACLPFFVAGQALHKVRYEFEHPQMGTTIRLVFYAGDSLAAFKTAAEVFALTDRLNLCFSDYLPQSEVSLLSEQAGSGAYVPASKDLWKLLKTAQRFSKNSSGMFDVSIGPLTRLWRRSRNLQVVPDSGRVFEACILVDYREINMRNLGKKVRLNEYGMQLDFGGIAQGYTADACLRLLRKRGYPQAMVDVGGDIAIGAAPPGQAGWQIQIPGQAEPLHLRSCGITTSGATYQFFEAEDGTRYSHILDLRTCWGVTHQFLVTVLAKNATEADALATTYNVLGPNAPKIKIRNHRVWFAQDEKKQE